MGGIYTAAPARTRPIKTITATAVDSGRFTTLLAALKAANLIDTLRTPGPYTLFAPSEAAFEALPAGGLKALLKDFRRLQTILTCHILSGAVHFHDLKPGSIRTIEGSSLLVAVNGGVVTVNGAAIAMPDLLASNGVIHVVDTLFMRKNPSVAAAA